MITYTILDTWILAVGAFSFFGLIGMYILAVTTPDDKDNSK